MNFRRFSGGFGSRDYRTSQTGSRPGGAMGQRNAGGSSFPNYNAPPPSHGKADFLAFLLGFFFLFFSHPSPLLMRTPLPSSVSVLIGFLRYSVHIQDIWA